MTYSYEIKGNIIFAVGGRQCGIVKLRKDGKRVLKFDKSEPGHLPRLPKKTKIIVP